MNILCLSSFPSHLPEPYWWQSSRFSATNIWWVPLHDRAAPRTQNILSDQPCAPEMDTLLGNVRLWPKTNCAWAVVHTQNLSVGLRDRFYFKCNPILSMPFTIDIIQIPTIIHLFPDWIDITLWPGSKLQRNTEHKNMSPWSKHVSTKAFHCLQCTKTKDDVAHVFIISHPSDNVQRIREHENTQLLLGHDKFRPMLVLSLHQPAMCK